MKYFRLIKFSHTLFSLPFALVGFLFALHSGYELPSWFTVLWILLALITARTAAMSFNRWTDHRIDAKNPRTKNREIPAGVIKPAQALMLAIISSAVFILLAALINELCLWLSPVALLVILGYSYTKRFTALAHLVLGIGLGIAPAATFIAVSGTFDPGLLFLCLGVMFWTAGFDIIYALQDMEFDREVKLYSIPAAIGYKNSLLLSASFHAISVTLIFLFWMFIFGNSIALAGVVMFSLMLIYQHTDVHRHGLNKVNLAFGTMNGVASLVYGAGYLLAFLLNH